MSKFLLWKLILLKLSDVNKQFLWENSAKTIDGLAGLFPLVLSDFEVDADTVQETMDDDVLIQILKLYYRLHPNEFR